MSEDIAQIWAEIEDRKMAIVMAEFEELLEAYLEDHYMADLGAISEDEADELAKAMVEASISKSDFIKSLKPHLKGELKIQIIDRLKAEVKAEKQR